MNRTAKALRLYTHTHTHTHTSVSSEIWSKGGIREH